MALTYEITNLKLKPAPTLSAQAKAQLHPEVQKHLNQAADWSKQAFESMQLMANAIRELQKKAS